MGLKTIKLEGLFFVVSIGFFALLYGFLAERYKLFPYHSLNRAVDQAEVILSSTIFTPHYLYPKVYEDHGVKTYNVNAIEPGLTLLTSFWPEYDWKAGIKLIDLNGNTIHGWELDPSKIWPEGVPDLSDINGIYPHGTYLFPNGDILFNIEYVGLIRMDSCGLVKWRLDYPTHHSISIDDDGNFWIPGNISRVKNSNEDRNHISQYPGLAVPIAEDRLLKVSPEGEILKDIDLIKVIYENDLQRYIPKVSKRRRGDIFHLNDIDVLREEMAAEYPLFEKGDIAVSLKYLHLVMVLDPNTGLVKWHSTDHVIEQHDPDFTGNGWITIFDNNADYSPRGEMLGGSRIVAIQPHSGESRVAYPVNNSERFYTKAGGKWQLLENKNMLITEARAGRAFETTADGELVWEWIHQPYDNNSVTEVLEASRYAITSEQVSSWSCGPEV